MRIADKINEAQNTDEMLRRLLEMSIKLYTDGAHFIYELLQNADDTEATLIKFVQHDQYLEVLHNGVPFTESNLQRICDACNSDKSDNEDKIGEFGIGFKSVFAICEKVRIDSAPAHFKGKLSYRYPEFSVEIVDFRKAVDIEPQYIEKVFTTRFVFPFAVGQSFTRFTTINELNEQVSKRLKQLGTATMLFLKNIETIKYEILLPGKTETGSFGLIPEKINDHCYLIKPKNNNGQESEISYLKFSRPIEQSPKRTVDIAFPVRIADDGKYEFQKADSPYISVFFPTQTESKLDFLVQAPYQLTPDRSNVSADSSTKEGKINRDLAQQTAKLLEDSIIELRDKSKINLSFWRILPLSKTNFRNFDLFEIFYDTVVRLAKTNDVIPCKNGIYANAYHVKLVRGQWLTQLFTDELLTELINSGINYFWLSDKITKDGEPNLYEFFHGANGLKIDQIEPSSFRSLFNSNPMFLLKRNNEWLIKLYTAFGDEREALFNKTSALNMLTTIFIKTTSGSFVAPYRRDGKNNYIPEIYLPSQTNFVNLHVVNEKIYKHCVHFFENILQLKKPDEYGCFIEDLKLRYADGYNVSDEQHIDDIKEILKYLKIPDKSEDIKKILEKSFLLRCKKDDVQYYVNSYSTACYFEKSKEGLEIKIYYQKLFSKYFVDYEFYEANGITYDDLLLFGVKTNIDDIHQSVLSYIVNNPNNRDAIVKSNVIFSVLKRDLNIDWYGRYRFNQYENIVSLILDRGYEWLYTDKMQLKSSKEISKHDLNSDIYGGIDYNSYIYTALQFKKNELDRQEDMIKEYDALPMEKKEVYLNQALEQRWGISLQDLEKRLAKEEADKQFEFPGKIVTSYELLKKHIAEEFYFAAPVRFEYLIRHVRTSKNPEDARTYLKSMYWDNVTRKYACQLCHNGVENFEACQIEQKLKSKYELDALHLCLCPACATKFRKLKNNDKEYDKFFEPLKLLKHEMLTKGIETLSFYDGELWFTQVHLAEIIESLSLLEEDKELQRKKMKNHIGKKVRHKKDGVGIVEYCDDSNITIIYEDKIKTYSLSMCVDNDLIELLEE